MNLSEVYVLGVTTWIAFLMAVVMVYGDEVVEKKILGFFSFLRDLGYKIWHWTLLLLVGSYSWCFRSVMWLVSSIRSKFNWSVSMINFRGVKLKNFNRRLLGSKKESTKWLVSILPHQDQSSSIQSLTDDSPRLVEVQLSVRQIMKELGGK